jgi:hypothetical protein
MQFFFFLFFYFIIIEMETGANQLEPVCESAEVHVFTA